MKGKSETDPWNRGHDLCGGLAPPSFAHIALLLPLSNFFAGSNNPVLLADLRQEKVGTCGMIGLFMVMFDDEFCYPVSLR